jgi:N-acetylglucosaminyldiphosphoundecaprenol N-acetyl-beta-D-mannosaminyltransferase
MTVPHSSLLEAPSRQSEITLARVRLNAIRRLECVQHVLDSLAIGRGGWIATANLDHLRRLQHPGDFRRIYESASLVLADGMPLVWASYLQGTPLPERVAGSDLIYSLTAGASGAGFSVFLLGGDEGTAEAAAERLIVKYPDLRVAGTHCPPVGFEKDPLQMAQLRKVVAESKADIVYVALGSPKQEVLIDQVRDVLPKAWWLGVGISFSFVCGEVKRAPQWFSGSVWNGCTGSFRNRDGFGRDTFGMAPHS